MKAFQADVPRRVSHTLWLSQTPWPMSMGSWKESLAARVLSAAPGLSTKSSKLGCLPKYGTTCPGSGPTSSPEDAGGGDLPVMPALYVTLATRPALRPNDGWGRGLLPSGG